MQYDDDSILSSTLITIYHSMKYRGRERTRTRLHRQPTRTKLCLPLSHQPMVQMQVMPGHLLNGIVLVLSILTLQGPKLNCRSYLHVRCAESRCSRECLCFRDDSLSSTLTILFLLLVQLLSQWGLCNDTTKTL